MGARSAGRELAAVTALSLAQRLLAAGGPVEFSGFFDAHGEPAAGLAAIGAASFDFTAGGPGEPLADAAAEALLSAAGDDLVAIDWDCAWPDESAGRGSVLLTANGTEGADAYDSRHTPGGSSVYLSVHPRAHDRQPDAYAARLARLAAVRLRADPTA